MEDKKLNKKYKNNDKEKLNIISDMFFCNAIW